MASIQSVGLTSATGTGSSTASAIMGKDDFLKLLITQLQNQDPLNPMSGADYAAQLAQFSSVEQLSNINTTLTQSVQQNQLLTQAIGNSLAATLIGKDIRATGNTVSYTGDSAVKLGYTLTSDAKDTTVSIYNSAGALVKTLQHQGTASGDNTLTWDGTDGAGRRVPAGVYVVRVTDGAESVNRKVMLLR